MTARDFMPADKAVAVEQFNTGRKKGCIVRWDFETVFNQIPAKKKAKRSAVKPMADQQEKSAQVDSGLVSFSVKVYPELPTADQVINDIQEDLKVRYAGIPQPEIDMEEYRKTIEELHTR